VIPQYSQTLSDEKAALLSKLINNRVIKQIQVKPGKTLSGKAIKRIDSELGQLERRYKKSMNAEDQTIGQALGDAKSTIRDYIGQQDPTGEINKLNGIFADFLRLENAAASSRRSDNVFSPEQLQASVRAMDESRRRMGFARGQARMQQTAQAGREMLGTRVPDSGTPERLALPITTAGIVSALGGSGAVPIEQLLIPGLLGLGATGAYTRPGQATIRALSQLGPRFTINRAHSGPTICTGVTNAQEQTIRVFSSTAADNADIGGINIAEGMAPQDVNNAMREQMVQLKEFLDGSSGDTITTAKIVATTATILSGASVTGTATFNSAVVMSSSVTGTTASFSGATRWCGCSVFYVRRNWGDYAWRCCSILYFRCHKHSHDGCGSDGRQQSNPTHAFRLLREGFCVRFCRDVSDCRFGVRKLFLCDTRICNDLCVYKPLYDRRLWRVRIRAYQWWKRYCGVAYRCRLCGWYCAYTYCCGCRFTCVCNS
jgi:hypothetical protein